MTAALDGLARGLASHAADSLLEGTLVALMAWIALRLLGRSGAATRFAVLLSALAVTLGLPLFRAAAGSSGSANAYSPVLRVGDSWAFAFVLVWAAFVAIALAHVASGVWRLRRLRRRCREVNDPHLRAEFAEMARRFCPSRKAAVLVSDEVAVPAAIGFVRPAVILPVWLLDELPAPELRHVVIHELAHLRRWDDWTNLLQKTVRALLFFHPAVWWMERRLSLEREMACDDAVLKQSGSARGYAECLLRIAERRRLRRGLGLAQAALGHVSQMSLRIARMFQLEGTAPAPLRRSAIAIGSLTAAAAFGLLWHAPLLVSFQGPATEAGAVAVAHSEAPPPDLKATWHVSAQPEPPARKVVSRPRATPAPVQAGVRHPQVRQTPHLAQAAATSAPDYEVLVVVFRTDNGSEVWHVAVWQVPAARRVPLRKTT